MSKRRISLFWCYYLHTSRKSVSPVCWIFSSHSSKSSSCFTSYFMVLVWRTPVVWSWWQPNTAVECIHLTYILVRQLCLVLRKPEITLAHESTINTQWHLMRLTLYYMYLPEIILNNLRKNAWKMHEKMQKRSFLALPWSLDKSMLPCTARVKQGASFISQLSISTKTAISSCH